MNVNSLPTMSLGQCSMQENRRELGDGQNHGCAKDNKHSKKKSPVTSKRARDHDSPNHDELTQIYKEIDCSKFSHNYHLFNTGSLVQLSTTTEEKSERVESPFYILEGPDPNLDLPIRMAENRVYGKVLELTPKDNEW